MKYKLIKCYPGSPKLGTIVESSTTSIPVGLDYIDNPCYSNIETDELFTEEQIEQYPDFWEPVKEDIEDTVEIIYNEILDYVYTSYFRTHYNVSNEENAVRLTCKKIGFAVEVSLYKSAIQNQNTAQKILRSFIEQNISKLSKL